MENGYEESTGLSGMTCCGEVYQLDNSSRAGTNTTGTTGRTKIILPYEFQTLYLAMETFLA